MTPPRPTILLVFFAALTVSWGAASAPAPATGAPAAAKPPLLSAKQKQIREEIDALYHHRNETPPVPNPAMNPFRPRGAAPVSTSSATSGSRGETLSAAVPQAPTTDLALLQRSVDALKVSGRFEKDGRLHLIINRKPYKQGDVIQILLQGETVYLRLRQVSRYSVTFALNETELTLNF